jgi:predicted amidohydrolase
MAPAEAVSVADANRDLIVGIKVRVGKHASGEQGADPLNIAIQAAEEAGMPVMCHIDHPPPSYEEVIGMLRPGDVLTHAFRPLFDQVTTMSKFLVLGMPLVDVIRASTVNAAFALKRPELGSLKPGSVGDATILSIKEGKFDYEDVTGEHMTGDKKIIAEGTVVAGKWWHPKRSSRFAPVGGRSSAKAKETAK